MPVLVHDARRWLARDGHAGEGPQRRSLDAKIRGHDLAELTLVHVDLVRRPRRHPLRAELLLGVPRLAPRVGHLQRRDLGRQRVARDLLELCRDRPLQLGRGGAVAPRVLRRLVERAGHAGEADAQLHPVPRRVEVGRRGREAREEAREARRAVHAVAEGLLQRREGATRAVVSAQARRREGLLRLDEARAVGRLERRAQRTMPQPRMRAGRPKRRCVMLSCVMAPSYRRLSPILRSSRSMVCAGWVVAYGGTWRMVKSKRCWAAW